MKKIISIFFLMTFIILGKLMAQDYDFIVNPYTGDFDMTRSSFSYDSRYITTTTYISAASTTSVSAATTTLQDQLNTLPTTYVNVTGDTATGPIVVNSTITAYAVGIGTGIPQTGLHVIGSSTFEGSVSTHIAQFNLPRPEYVDTAIFQNGIDPSVSLPVGYDVVFSTTPNSIPNGSTVTAFQYSIANTGQFRCKIGYTSGTTIYVVYVDSANTPSGAGNNLIRTLSPSYTIPRDGNSYYAIIRATSACTIRTPASGYTGATGSYRWYRSGDLQAGQSGTRTGVESVIESYAPIASWIVDPSSSVIISSNGVVEFYKDVYLKSKTTCYSTVNIVGPTASTAGSPSLRIRGLTLLPKFWFGDDGKLGLGIESPVGTIDNGNTTQPLEFYWRYFGYGNIHMGFIRDWPSSNVSSWLANNNGYIGLGDTQTAASPTGNKLWLKIGGANGWMQLGRGNTNTPESLLHLSSGTIFIDGNTTQAILTNNCVTVGSTTINGNGTSTGTWTFGNYYVPASKTTAQLEAITAPLGASFWCSDCTTPMMFYSTGGATPGAWVSGTDGVTPN